MTNDMEKFNKVVEQLDASCIVIVENDLKEESSENAILAKFVILSSINKELLVAKLSQKGYTTLVAKLVEFDLLFKQIPHGNDKMDYLSTGNIESYLTSLNNHILLVKSTEIEAEIKKSPLTKLIFFQYGITEGDSVYNQFIEQIISDKTHKPCLLLFQDILPANLAEFERDLLTAMNGKSKSFIAIVDKMLNGVPNGLKIANEYIASISKRNHIVSYPFILTSLAATTSDPDKLSNYSQLVVSKSSTTLIDDICQTISINAYSQIFNYFENQMLESLSKASDTAAQNKSNIAYIVNKANEEGMLPYEAIRIWYENALNLYTNNSILTGGSDNFTATIGLSKLINKDIADEGKLPPEFVTHLKELNTNEIFDYSINAKHLPIAPGDVFVSGENYFVLIGQTCDVSLRDDLKRSSTLVKVVSASFEALKVEKKKYYKVVRDKEFVKYNCFKNKDHVIGILKVELKTKSTLYYDYIVFDTCMYNVDGKCEIDIKKPLEKPLINYLTESSAKHYTSLQIKISELKKISEDAKKILEDKTNGLLTHTIAGNTISFPFQRICRIKGNFNHLIHHNYWHYRGRTDLNEINLTEE